MVDGALVGSGKGEQIMRVPGTFHILILYRLYKNVILHCSIDLDKGGLIENSGMSKTSFIFNHKTLKSFAIRFY